MVGFKELQKRIFLTCGLLGGKQPPVFPPVLGCGEALLWMGLVVLLDQVIITSASLSD